MTKHFRAFNISLTLFLVFGMTLIDWVLGSEVNDVNSLNALSRILHRTLCPATRAYVSGNGHKHRTAIAVVTHNQVCLVIDVTQVIEQFGTHG